MSNPAAPSCPRCQIGYLSAQAATYSLVHNGLFFSVPNVPAWTCDICQYQEFDYEALIEIEALVGHLELPTEASRQAAKRPPYDADMLESKRPPRLKP